jgi:tetratricopeptide (TPR) repeat protein
MTQKREVTRTSSEGDPLRRLLGLLIILFLAITAPWAVAAGEPKSSPISREVAARLFAKGNDLYMEAKRLASEGKGDAAKSKFSEAEVVYEQIGDGGFVNWQVLYNLGNALYQQGAIGKAVACYLRAQRLAPRQEDVEINLQKAKSEARDKESAPAVPAFLRTLLFPYFRLSADEVAAAGLASYFVFGALLILIVFVRRLWAKALCAIALATTLALGATLAAKVFLEQRAERGVIVCEVCPVWFGPGPEYAKRFEAHEGAELVVLARSKDAKTGRKWLKVRLFIEVRSSKPAEGEAETSASASRAEGWVQGEDVELL